MCLLVFTKFARLARVYYYLIMFYLIIQELRGLVRKVQSLREKGTNLDEEEGKVNSDVARAESSLTRFLRVLAKQLHS